MTFAGRLRWLDPPSPGALGDACHDNQDNRDKCAQYATALATAMGAAPLMPLLRDQCLDTICGGQGNLPPPPPIPPLFPWDKVAPETLATQKMLNVKLAEDGLCAIPENGVLDAETCGAAKHYGATITTCQGYTSPKSCPKWAPAPKPAEQPVPPPPPTTTAPVQTSSSGLIIGGLIALVGVGFVVATVAGGSKAPARLENARHDPFLDGYIEAALFSSLDESTPSGGEPLDKHFGPADLTRDAMKKMKRDADRFARANAELIAGREREAGIDFWFTRNGHGAGFWDGDWPEPAASVLTKASKAFGSQDIYVHRRRLYVSP